MANVLELTGLVPRDTALGIAQALAEAPFRDGRASAMGRAREVKHNEQLAEDDPRSRTHAHTLFTALSACAPFRAAAIPHTIMPLRFCRYRDGMGYGDHLDAPVLSTANGPIRTDLSLTIWLSDASSYEGGELVLHGIDGATRTIKGDAGDAVLYSSSTLHRVNPVTAGERIVAISWLQSVIADDDQRDILFQLAQLATTLQDRPDELTALHHLNHRLTRMWAQC